MRFHLIIAFWGKTYSDLFLNFALPNLLSPGNLGAFGPDDDVLFKIYTKPSDIERIQDVPSFARLKAMVPVKIVEIPEETTNTIAFEGLLFCHSLAIRAAYHADAALIFLSPDSLFSDGSLAHVLRLAKMGKRVVLSPGLRVVRETFIPALQALHPLTPEGALVLPPRELMRITMEYLHPVSESYYTDSPTFNKRPSHIYWRVEQEGILVRALHMHPLLIYPCHLHTTFGSIDYDYLMVACPDYDKMHVVEDSDDILGVEMSPVSYQDFDIAPNRFSPFKYSDFCLYSFPYHHKFFRHKVRLHCDDCSPQWEAVEAESDRIIEQILFRLEFLKYKRFKSLLRYPGRLPGIALRKGGRSLRVLARLTLRQLVGEMGARAVLAKHPLYHIPRYPFVVAKGVLNRVATVVLSEPPAEETEPSNDTRGTMV